MLLCAPILRILLWEEGIACACWGIRQPAWLPPLISILLMPRSIDIWWRARSPWSREHHQVFRPLILNAERRGGGREKTNKMTPIFPPEKRWGKKTWSESPPPFENHPSSFLALSATFEREREKNSGLVRTTWILFISNFCCCYFFSSSLGEGDWWLSIIGKTQFVIFSPKLVLCLGWMKEILERREERNVFIHWLFERGTSL